MSRSRLYIAQGFAGLQRALRGDARPGLRAAAAPILALALAAIAPVAQARDGAASIEPTPTEARLCREISAAYRKLPPSAKLADWSAGVRLPSFRHPAWRPESVEQNRATIEKVLASRIHPNLGDRRTVYPPDVIAKAKARFEAYAAKGSIKIDSTTVLMDGAKFDLLRVTIPDDSLGTKKKPGPVPGVVDDVSAIVVRRSDVYPTVKDWPILPHYYSIDILSNDKGSWFIDQYDLTVRRPAAVAWSYYFGSGRVCNIPVGRSISAVLSQF